MSSSFISAVLCLHPSSQLYCVFILHLSCTVSSSLPTVHPFSQLHCVFISANSCWCSSIGRIYCIVGILAVLCLHLYHLLLVFFNWNDPTDWIVGISTGKHCWIEASSFACMTLLSIYWYIWCMSWLKTCPLILVLLLVHGASLRLLIIAWCWLVEWERERKVFPNKLYIDH